MPPPEATPFAPPLNWRTLYKAAKAYRDELVPESEFAEYRQVFSTTVPPDERHFRILVALMLSARTRSQANLLAMQRLLEKGPLTPTRVRDMPTAELQRCIRNCCYYNNKTKYIKRTAAILLTDYDGRVPSTYKELIALPGVGPKMAHLYFQAADGQVLGIGVDTHVHRISQRFQWVPPTVKSPEDTRKVLESWLPRAHWEEANLLLVGLGQKVCRPVSPRCGECKLNKLCPNAFKEEERLQVKSAAKVVKAAARNTKKNSNNKDKALSATSQTTVITV